MSATPLFDLAPGEWATLRRLLDDALDQPVGERAAWLAALPAEHERLKPRLRSLLAHADGGIDAPATGHAGGGFGTLPRLAPSEQASADEAALPPDAGPYRATRLLGEGGMGRVWLAERTDMLHGRPVALKLPHAFSRHPRLAERMAQEREILAVLDHPNIARIYDAGVTADGQPYLALEYVEGERIDAYAKRLRLGVRERVALFLQVTAAVAHAHARLVVHRDLKPGNILVTGEGQVRLLDFGIAKLIAANADGAPLELTAPAQRALTPQYAAPEQILGQPIGTAADIYSLGVVLYELLTGELPYKPRRASAAALEETIVSAEPPRPSQRTADARARRALQGDLDTVLLKALKKDPAERYATVQALADDLANWLADRPVKARPDSTWYHARKFVRRNRLGVALAAGFVLSLGGALGAALWQAGEARAQAAKAGAITDFLVGLFRANDIEQAEGRSKRGQSVQQLLEKSADALGSSLAGQPELRTELQRVVGRLLHDLDIGEAAVRVRQQRADALRGASTGERLAALRELADSQRAANQLGAARATLATARGLCPPASRSSPADCLGIEVDGGRLDFIASQWDAALARVTPVLPLLEARAPRGEDLAAAYELLASLHAARNQAEPALGLFRQALALRREMWGEGSVRLAQSRYRFGRTLWALRRPALAEAELREAWQTTVRAVGPEHLIAARIEANLGRLQFYVGSSQEGLPHLQHALQALLTQADRVDPFEVYQARMYWSNALLLDGRLAEARAALDETLALRERLEGQVGPDVTLDVSEARWLVDTGRFAEGRAILVRLRDQAIARSGPDHPDVADRRFRLAQAWLASGDLAQAEAELNAAMRTQDATEAVFGSPKHRAQLVLIALRVAQGQFAQAAPLAESLVRGARATPRGDQYRETLVQLHAAVGRTWAGLGRHADAQAQFAQAAALLEPANPDHPVLAELRAAWARSLAATGDGAGACRELALARAALRRQPLAGPQYQRALRETQARLACPAPSMSGSGTAMRS
ncbi:protein kinase domain-containing protein [Ideonella sp.]|uniref:protein kinase domain-containing protein n=1 Tax=Ideonella sp. TaxID=1929293 RepID=UPI002B4975EB|nr:protein kinase [Ideonella sp.]HJV70949.1 protein kinase [Ideonella sp.]